VRNGISREETKLGEQEAQVVVGGIKVKEDFENKKNSLATKEDIANLKTEIALAESRLSWKLFLFWVGTIGVLSGIMFAML